MSDQTTTPVTDPAAATTTAETTSAAEIAALREELRRHEITAQEFRAQLDAIKAEREAEKTAAAEAAKTKATVVQAPATGADDPAKPKGKAPRRWF